MREEFSQKTRSAALDRAAGQCETMLKGGVVVMSGTDGAARCQTLLSTMPYVFDHDDPDWFGGKNNLDNCVVRCRSCDRMKTALDQGKIAKAKRIIGREKRTKINRYPAIPGSKRSGLKKSFDGSVTRR